MKESIIIITILLLCNACVSNKEYNKLLSDKNNLSLQKKNLEKEISTYRKYINETAEVNLIEEIDTMTCSNNFKYYTDQHFNKIESTLKSLSALDNKVNLAMQRVKLDDFKNKHNILFKAKNVLHNDYDSIKVATNIHNLRKLEIQLNNTNTCDQYILNELNVLLHHLNNYYSIYKDIHENFCFIKDYKNKDGVHDAIDKFKKAFKTDHPKLILSKYVFLHHLIEKRYTNYNDRTHKELKALPCN